MQSVSEDERPDFAIPPPVVQEVLAYAEGKGELTEDYFELKGDEWVKLKGNPDMAVDHRPAANDAPPKQDRAERPESIPDFVERICSSADNTNLFKAVMEDPLSKEAADAYVSVVDKRLIKEARNRKFKGEVKLPLSRVRETVMTCAFLDFTIRRAEASPSKGKEVLDQDGRPVPGPKELRQMNVNWTKHYIDLMDDRGYPSEWKKFLGDAVPKLSSRRGSEKPYTDKEIQDVISQHGKPSNDSIWNELSKDRQQAQKADSHINQEPETLASKSGSKPSASATKDVNAPGDTPATGTDTRKRKRAESPGNGLQKQAKISDDGESAENDSSQSPQPSRATVDGDTSMGGVDQDYSDGAPQTTTSASDAETSKAGERGADGFPPNDEVVLPADMSWYVGKWKDATTLIGNLLHEPRLIRQEPGKQMEALNNDILGRVTHDQEQGVNVDLQVPAMELLRVLMLSTAALVDSGKHEADEIEDLETTAAFDQLKLRLERAKQPQPWEDELRKTIKLKVKAWAEHTAAGTQPGEDKSLWDEDLKDLVCEAAYKSSDSTQADVFADPENKTGKIGGFRVASRKRDGTEHYQVLVQVGVYGEAQRVQGTLWHINAASMYRDTIVEEYKKGGGTQITSLDGGIGELREHNLSGVQISGIAIIPRTTAKGYRKMPTMFIQGSIDDGKGQRFWSRTYMGRVWGQNAVIRKIRDFTDKTGMPVLTNDAQQPSLLMPEGASKRTCKAWGVAYVGRAEESRRRGDITNDRDGDLDRNDGVYDQDDGFVVHDEEQPLDPTSEEFRKADKKRRMEELEVELARLKESMKEDVHSSLASPI